MRKIFNKSDEKGTLLTKKSFDDDKYVYITTDYCEGLIFLGCLKSKLKINFI